MPLRRSALVATAIVIVLSSALLLHFHFKEPSPIAKISGTSVKQQGSVPLGEIEEFREESWVEIPSTKTSTSQPDFSCPSNIGWLNNLHLDYPLKYARRDIIVKPTRGLQRSSVTKVEEALLPDFQTIMDPTVAEHKAAYCKEPLVLAVPSIPDGYADASHIVFAVSTSLQRLEDSILYFQRWLAHTKARLVAQVVGPDESKPDAKEMKKLETLLNDLGICATVVRPRNRRDDMPERYFSLVKLAYEHRNERTRWISLLDDDTFITSMPMLLKRLSEYDETKQQYVGALSEEWWTVGRYGMMAMGGAGVFLSLPLVEVLNKNYQSCKDRSRAGAGDIRVFECVKWHTNTKLTHVPGLQQIDLQGDRSGLFESGRQFLTLHHWKEGWWDESGLRLADTRPMSWFPMASMHLVASICDTCFLQRWQFGNDMVLSNGYSLAIYPTGALRKFSVDMGLERVEHTWMTPAVIEGSHNEGFDHYLGPLRPRLELEKDKVQYRFLDAEAVDGGVRQWYLRLGNSTEDRMDELVELFWTRER